LLQIKMSCNIVFSMRTTIDLFAGAGGASMEPWVSIGTALGINTTIIGGGTNPREPEGKRTYRDITNEPSTTVAAVQIGNAGPFIIDEDNRRLTWRECAKLQGFPDDHPFQGKTQASFYKQVGNAVCPIVSEVLGRCVMTAMDS
jgi:site-specific DNA-cytosine methylase